ncbi:hypothetical protein N7497_005447 [Penicillium chrysogenum]|nr:hypothetical protein N7497_005447 [Penicillium chrysogenum]
MKKGLLRTSEDLICLLSTRGIDALRPQPTAAYKTRSRPQTQGPNKLSEGNTATVLQGGFLLKGICHPPPPLSVFTPLTYLSIPPSSIHLSSSSTFPTFLCFDTKASRIDRFILSYPPALASVHLQHEGELHVVIIGSSTCHPILWGLGLLQHPLTLLVIRSYTTTPNICKVITTA